MDVEIWIDLVCPWCHLGKHRFETALAGFEHREEVTVVWRSFQLSADRSVSTDAQIAHVTELAAEHGLAYALDKARPANTRDAHRLVHYARSIHARSIDAGTDGAMVERLLRAYTSEGRSLDDIDTLVELADEVGLDGADVRKQLAGNAFDAEVLADQAHARERGVTGVPAFLFGAYGIAGAQPPDVFTAMLKTMRFIGQPS
jgi:predicted DsbA family dithiol-disulfide isomerase